MKNRLRAHFRGLRKSIEPEARLRAEKALIAQLEELSKEFDFVASFSSYGSEIDLSAINRKLASQNRLLLPRRCGEELHFYAVSDLSALEGEPLKEPKPFICTRVCLFSKRVLVLVPGLAFSLDLYRLGSGKAFYDRFLEKHPEIFSVGVGFLSQLSSDPLPRELWDRPVSKLILV